LNGVVSIPDLQAVGDDGVPREQVELHLKDHFTNEVKESAEQLLVDFLRGKDIANSLACTGSNIHKEQVKASILHGFVRNIEMKDSVLTP
jgi:hypothetical protein